MEKNKSKIPIKATAKSNKSINRITTNSRSGPVNQPYLTPLTRLRKFKEIRDRNLISKQNKMETAAENVNGGSEEIVNLKQQKNEKLTNGKEDIPNSDNGVATDGLGKKIEQEIKSPEKTIRKSPEKTIRKSPRRTVEKSEEIGGTTQQSESILNGKSSEKDDIESVGTEEEVEVDVVGETEEEESTPEKESQSDDKSTTRLDEDKIFAPQVTPDSVRRNRYGLKVHGRRPIRGFVTPFLGSKRKGQSLPQCDTPAEKKYQMATPSTQSPGWRYLSSPVSFFWKCQNNATPARGHILSDDDSMAVNVDDLTLNKTLDDSNFQADLIEVPKSSWRCNIM